MFNYLKNKTMSLKNDALSGLTVALALVPEAVAFAFVAGVDPLVGLYAAFMIGLITSIFGGRPGMISGATGALAVVMVSLVAKGNEMGLLMDNPIIGLGVYYLFLTVILMGSFQILAGLFKLGKFVRLIPHPVMMGFVNGLAIVIFLSQVGMFKNTVTGEWLVGTALLSMAGLVLLTMVIMFILPKYTRKIPAALVAIVTVTVIAIVAKLNVSTVGSMIRDGGGTGLSGGLPVFQTEIFSFIPFNLETLYFILPYALILAAIGLIESLMTLNLLDEITGTRGQSNRECVAQGSANIVTGLFGGMGGCAMIGQSLINVESGGRGRASGIIAALALLAFILFLSGLIEIIPVAALVGVMFMVVIGTFAWSSFDILNKIPKGDAFVLVLVSGMTVVFDLAIAVIAGVIVSALMFSWDNATRIHLRIYENKKGVKVYEVWGPLFFGSITDFISRFDVSSDPKKIEIEFKDSRICDHSAIECIEKLVKKYEKAGKEVYLKHLSDDCKSILSKSNKRFNEHVVNSSNDPEYFVLSDGTDKKLH